FALLTRLADERAAARKWRRKSAALGALAAAAVVMIAIGGWMLDQQATLRAVALPPLPGAVKRGTYSAPPPHAAEKAYKDRGIDMKAPPSLNYGFLAHYGMAELQGHQVPCLIFLRDDPTANIRAHAKVYVLSDHQFNLKEMPPADTLDTGYERKIEV